MWMGFEDSESGIAKYEVSLWNFSSCANESVAEAELQHDWIELTHNYSEYSFVELELKVRFYIHTECRCVASQYIFFYGN
jgi:hypothetical protein